MEILFKVVLGILMFLAISSGITKMILMPQDVEFFGAYGFTNPILVAFGAAQFIGGIFLVSQKTRFLGAAIVAITFLISAVVLIMADNVPVAIVTFAAISLLGWVMKTSLKQADSVRI